MTWSLYENDEFLEPLKFSNGKTQEDVVKEVLNAIEQGHKIIFVHGICGTGKSAIALNIARNLGKTSIVVPGKNLQTQYQKDYEGKKYLLKKDKEKLKIRVMTGRKNHKCKFLEDNKNSIPRIVREVDAKLNDIFEGKKDRVRSLLGKDLSADNKNIPCKIEIKEKNWNRIKEYLRKNKRVDVRDFLDLKDVKRISVAGVCPYWCPVLPEKYELKQFENAKKREYLGLNNTKFIFYARGEACGFYNQFNSYIDADAIIFNSLKYKLESALNRKPQTEVEVIDECDEFLDSFSNQRTINIDRLQNSLSNIFGFKQEDEYRIREIEEITKQIKRNERINEAVDSGAIIPIRETGVYDLLRIFLDSPEFLEEIDEESYLFEIEETARMFEEFFDESYLTVNKRDDSLTVSIVTTNLAKRFQEMVDKNKIIVLMSGTLHSSEVLGGVFGLKDYKIIEAETEQQGRIKIQRTGKEMDCKYSNLNGRFSREEYLNALSKCIEIAKKPVLVHVNAFLDLPSEQELAEFDIDNLISREKLREIQDEDKVGVLVERFKAGQTDVLFTTRCGRGIDFPGGQCNSIVFTKYPNPNVQDAFWQILNKTKPEYYWSFYKDKARRELWQKIYRGLRFKEDHIYLLSPDSRVLEVFSNP
jgi:Rad3-related DNA helicase